MSHRYIKYGWGLNVLICCAW